MDRTSDRAPDRVADLDVRRLRVLREVALRGTIAAAAASLGYTPSAISQQLSALERETASTLVRRAGRGLQLTAAGQLLVERTEAVLVALEEARAALELTRTQIAGEIRLAAAGSVARALVVPMVADVSAEYPELRVTMLAYEPEESVRELRLGALDVVVAFEYDHARSRPEPDLVRTDLFCEDMLVVAPAGRYTPPVALADLEHEVWAAEPTTSSCGHALRSACRAVGFEPDIRFESREVGVLLGAVGAGAVSLLPRLGTVGVPVDVDVLPIGDVPTRRYVYAARRRGETLRPGVALVLDRLQEVAAGYATNGAAMSVQNRS